MLQVDKLPGAPGNLANSTLNTVNMHGWKSFAQKVHCLMSDGILLLKERVLRPLNGLIGSLSRLPRGGWIKNCVLTLCQFVVIFNTYDKT
jgi:hypothetical protein